MGGEAAPGGGGALEQALLEKLPAAVFVIDSSGVITFATGRAAQLVGSTPEEVTGESVLRFVSADAAWAYSAAVALATDYADTVMGPLRISFAGRDGEPRVADLWATNHLDDPEVAGIVCLLTEQTTAMGLGEASAAIAAGEPLPVVAARVASALAGHPVVSDAVVLTPAGSSLRPLVPAPVPTELVTGLAEGPALDVHRSGARRLYAEPSEIPEALAPLADAAGYGALWVEPVTARSGANAAVLALCRPHAGSPSPNELSAVHRAAGILALAFTLEGG